MKRSGRFNPFIVVGLICVIVLVPLLLISKRGAGNYASDFMVALSTGNADQLAKLSIIGQHNYDERRQLWQESVNSAKYFTFTWRISDVTDVSADRAAVIVMMRRNLEMRMGEDESRYELPMQKTDDGWKVVVDQMNREMYPFLPRP